MHPDPVITLILIISLYTKKSFGELTLKLQVYYNNIKVDSPISKHQRKLVSQVKVKLNPAKFSKSPAVCVNITDSTEETINQSEVM